MLLVNRTLLSVIETARNKFSSESLKSKFSFHHVLLQFDCLIKTDTCKIKEIVLIPKYNSLGITSNFQERKYFCSGRKQKKYERLQEI